MQLLSQSNSAGIGALGTLLTTVAAQMTTPTDRLSLSWIAAIAGVVGTLGGGAAAAVIKIWGDSRLAEKNAEIARLKEQRDAAVDIAIEYNKDLRVRRIPYYERLWSLLQPLARYPEPTVLKPDDVLALGLSLREWYFGGGGLFLSPETRDLYFDLQCGLKITLEKRAQTLPVPFQANDLKKYLQRADDWQPPSELTSLLDGGPGNLQDEICDAMLSQLRSLGSRLRTGLTQDVQTRRAPKL